ncbi:MAG: hypothetical protein M3P01_07515 [Actinomycetota bacterium]|nr:hypothetical protein [Actinomycetota bacterium]
MSSEAILRLGAGSENGKRWVGAPNGGRVEPAMIRSLKVTIPSLVVVSVVAAAVNFAVKDSPKAPAAAHAPCSSGRPPPKAPPASPSSSPVRASKVLRADAAQLAHDAGISVAAAIRAIRLQPTVGRLGAALEQKGPPSYGGAFIDYKPRYRITLLSKPGCRAEVAAAVPQLGFSDLEKFTRVRETPFTQDVLGASMTRVQNAAGSYLTTLDSDIRTGRILAAAANAADVASVRSAIAALQPPLRARGVIVKIGRFVDNGSQNATP